MSDTPVTCENIFWTAHSNTALDVKRISGLWNECCQQQSQKYKRNYIRRPVFVLGIDWSCSSHEFLYILCFLQPHYALGSTQPLTEKSTRNLLGDKVGRRVGLANSPPSVSRLSRKCGNLDVSQPYGPSLPATGMHYCYLWKSLHGSAPTSPPPPTHTQQLKVRVYNQSIRKSLSPLPSCMQVGQPYRIIFFDTTRLGYHYFTFLATILCKWAR
jgi:hypothetical protein